ncbi:ATP-dependent DNA helicase PIF1-like protein [Tanacetum coccineum]
MTPTDSSWPFQFRRRQFPVKVCFGMTINKSQGQTFNNVCAFLSKPVFTHGQLYVVASRVTSRSGLRFYIDNDGLCANNLMKNVVYKEVFYNLPRDVINILTEWGPLMEKTRNNASDNSNVRSVVIRKTEYQVTIWGELASKFDDDIILSKNDHSVVVNEQKSSSVDLYSGMFEKLMAGVEIDSTYILDANIVGVDLVNDWKFVQCTQCFGKANWNKDHYFCEKSTSFGNGCHVMDCVFFNQYARNLLGVSVDDLINKALTLGADNRYWIEDYFVMNLYGERVVIEIKVDKFNLPPECSRRFTIVKYFVFDGPGWIYATVDIVSEAYYQMFADVLSTYARMLFIPVSSRVTNDVKPTDNVADVIGEHKYQHGEDVLCNKDNSNFASKNDSINGVVDNSVIHADNAEAENIDIWFAAGQYCGDMDVDDVGHESEIGVYTHSYSDADEELE